MPWGRSARTSQTSWPQPSPPVCPECAPPSARSGAMVAKPRWSTRVRGREPNHPGSRRFDANRGPDGSFGAGVRRRQLPATLCMAMQYSCRGARQRVPLRPSLQNPAVELLQGSPNQPARHPAEVDLEHFHNARLFGELSYSGPHSELSMGDSGWISTVIAVVHVCPWMAPIQCMYLDRLSLFKK